MQRPVASVMTALATVAIGVAGSLVHAQKPIESSAETRFQLDLQVPDAALRPFLPRGFTLDVRTEGAAKDCNLRAVFVDRITINAPDGKPVGKGSSRLVYLEAPVKDPGGGSARLVIGGLTSDPADTPGPFGNFLHASTATLKRAISAEASTVIETQEWTFRASSGEEVEMRITFERGTAVRNSKPTETRFYSAKDPGIYQISRDERALEIIRNPTTNPPDKVRQFDFKGSGGTFASLFDGTHRTVSWDNIMWQMRTVLVP